MKASIIIPSYNSSERLYLNLVSLKYQDYPHEDFEVIVIDNGSSDDTETMLSNFEADFALKRIHINENRGIARGRNKGILEASGDILIFHDSDMIAAKDFVRRHIEAHHKENIVVCGLPWLRIYSYFYKVFASYEMYNFSRHIYKYNLETDYWLKDKYKLITEQQIKDGSFLNLAFDLDMDFITSLKETMAIFGEDLKGYNLPWRFFITNNASVDRKQVIEVGSFDENIVRYGFEDYDLGIRLYKTGGEFKLSHDIISVHQEHPKNATPNDVKENVNYMCEKYNNIYYIDMILLCLSYSVPVDYQSINSVMSDINRMHILGNYNDILSIFLEILQTAIKISFKHDIDAKSTMLPYICKNYYIIKKQLKELQEEYQMFHFTNMFSGLMKSIFNM
ncbi:glycosyltransferase family 2 protein [Desnuesiella massiliensis]|uniref:glycosyltransferase family 2 protein n=1 Tax=Desnuesiella massiliensis TaxID=1650662 RepID=UPI0006E35680|nr:glycosyltransferase [Desnuesiella massiliensis]